MYREWAHRRSFSQIASLEPTESTRGKILHAPHQVPKEWSNKYKGKFDQGWDSLREQTFARQKQLGVIPQNAKLTPRDPAFPAWDSFQPDVKKLYAHQMEVYAGYQENTDNAVGRVVKAIEDMK